MKPPVCVLHHHVGTQSIFETGLGVTTSRAAYEAQLDRLTRDYDPIDLTTLLSGRLPRRPLLFTFDDAFRSVIDIARDYLAPRNIPAVYFVNPGLIGQQALSFDGAIAWAVETVGLSRLCSELGVQQYNSIGGLIGHEMAQRSARERLEIKNRIVSTFGPPKLEGRNQLLEEDDLALLTTLGVELGNHTMTHTHCRALEKDELQSEIIAAKARIEALSNTSVRAFSVPYGHERDLTPKVLHTLRSSGHEAIFLVHARSNAYRPAPDIWYRTNLTSEPPHALARKLYYLPMLRSLVKHVTG